MFFFVLRTVLGVGTQNQTLLVWWMLRGNAALTVAQLRPRQLKALLSEGHRHRIQIDIENNNIVTKVQSHKIHNLIHCFICWNIFISLLVIRWV